MSKKVLIVDDTYEKVQIIAAIVKDIEFCEIEHCNSCKSALQKMNKEMYDVLIVDLQIPIDMGSPIEKDGGVQLIEHCRNSPNIKNPTHILGITSHQESFDENREFFNSHGWPLILGVTDKELLGSIITSQIEHSVEKAKTVDVAIITALVKTELESVLKLPCDWKEVNYKGDNNIYYLGTIIQDSGQRLEVVATSCARMGMASAAATTMKVCNKFHPKLAIMTGIAAGVEGKTQLGDILIADPCWDWGSGKYTVRDGNPTLLSAPHQISLDTSYRSELQNISATRRYLDEIANAWPHANRPPSPLNLHVGPLASGAVVLEDPETVSSIVRQHRETIGVEMEAYGFAYAASICEGNQTKSLIIKSVCDFANPEKNDNWQHYAAFTSSTFAYKFLVTTALV